MGVGWICEGMQDRLITLINFLNVINAENRSICLALDPIDSQC